VYYFSERRCVVQFRTCVAFPCSAHTHTRTHTCSRHTHNCIMTAIHTIIVPSAVHGCKIWHLALNGRACVTVEVSGDDTPERIFQSHSAGERFHTVQTGANFVTF
jgi:hypothetical protein